MQAHGTSPSPIDARVCQTCTWRPIPDDRAHTICTTCETLIRGHLTVIADASPLLGIVAVTEPTKAGMLNLGIVDLGLSPQTLAPVGPVQDQIGDRPLATVLAGWVERWSGRDVLTADASSCALWLRRIVGWAAIHRDADIAEFAADVRSTVLAVRRALGRDMRGHRYDTPCPGCGEKTLLRRPGADWVECRPCRRLWTPDEYAALALEQLRAYVPANWPLDADAAARIAGVKVHTIWQWKCRGRIVPDIGPWGGVRYLRIEIDRAQAELEHKLRERAARREDARMAA